MVEIQELSAQKKHEQFTKNFYELYPHDLQSLISAYGDAAHMCNAIAANIRRENMIKIGGRAGQISAKAEAMAQAVERAGNAIWNLRTIVEVKHDE